MKSIDDRKLLPAFMMIIFICFSCSLIDNIAGQGKPYVNDRYGFSLRYPANWKVNDTGFMGSAAVFINTPHKSDFKPSVNVFVRDSKGLDLIRFVENSRKGLESEVKEVSYKFKKFISEERTRLGKLEAFELTYLFTQGGLNLKARTVHLVNKDTAYIVTMTALESDFEGVNGDFGLFLRSFRIK